MVDKLRDITPDSGYTELTRALTITTDGYWANHLDFGLPSRMATPALLGEGRAADIIVNALLPFTVAWARTIAQPAMVARAFSLYRQHPRLPVNTLERHMKTQLNINSCFINSARRQQGLIHIYKTMCSQGKCHTCPIGRQSTDSRLYPR
ncbi:MAG: hypothetical protein A2144_14660 [Chloroflexi bacterium RBG_16_50_9]|nr:MAG: hypothetical protein A2144_14660 [Chloroflexi bacterium RBG_16_50_9]